MIDYADIIKKLKSNNLRITPQRKIILTILCDKYDKVISINALFNEAKKRSASLNLSTLYRNLQQLEILNIVSRINLEDGKDYFTLVCDESHHHHIICTNCGKKIILKYCPYNEMLNAARQESFTLTGHSILLYGLCETCAKSI